MIPKTKPMKAPMAMVRIGLGWVWSGRVRRTRQGRRQLHWIGRRLDGRDLGDQEPFGLVPMLFIRRRRVQRRVRDLQLEELRALSLASRTGSGVF